MFSKFTKELKFTVLEKLIEERDKEIELEEEEKEERILGTLHSSGDLSKKNSSAKSNLKLGDNSA